MLVTVSFLTIIGVAVYSFLRRPAVRARLSQVWAFVHTISIGGSDILVGYLYNCILALIVILAGLAIGLIIRHFWSGVGNAIITAIFTIVGVLLLGHTLFLTAINQIIIKVLEKVREKGGEIKKSLSGVLEPKEEEKPKSRLFQFFLSLISLRGIIEIISPVPATLMDTAEGIASAVKSVLSGVTMTLLFVFCAALAALFLPAGVSFFWIFVLMYSLLLLLYLGIIQGKLKPPYSFMEKWVRRAAKVAIAFIIIAAISPLGPRYIPHILIGISTKAGMVEEGAAKRAFGQRFDQRLFEVVDAGYCYQGNEETQAISRLALLQVGTPIWKTERRPIEVDGLQYGEYQLPSPDGLISPSGDRVFFPESKVRAKDVELKKAVIPFNTAYYPDSDGLPAAQPLWVTRQWLVEVVGNRSTTADGQQVALCRVIDRDNIYLAWVPVGSLK